MNANQVRQAKTMRVNGFSLREIARVIGVPYKEVHQKLTGSPPSVKPNRRKRSIDEIVAAMIAERPGDAEWERLVRTNFQGAVT